MSDSIFGLLKPGEANMLALRRELEVRRDHWSRTGYAYKGGGDFILQHGVFRTGRKLPDQYAHHIGEPQRCFNNARLAAEADPTLRYCEGVYAVNGIICPHAWCLDPSGEVVEVTYPSEMDDRFVDPLMGMPIVPIERVAYAGVIFPVEFARWHADEIEECMLDRPAAEHDPRRTHGFDYTQHHDFPVLRVPFDPNRLSL